VAELGVGGGAVVVHFAGVLGFEVAFFQVDDEVAAQVEVIKEEVEVDFAVAYFEAILASDEGEAAAEFEEELQQHFLIRYLQPAIGARVVPQLGEYRGIHD